MNLQGKTILVVGASGVLGQNISAKLSEAGASVIGVVHSPKPGRFHDLQFDLKDFEQVSALASHFEKLDGLVIASGVVGFGSGVETNLAQHEELMRVNFEGPRLLATLLVPKLAASGSALVAAITGVVAERAFPGMASYVASKSALSSWLDAFRLDVKAQNISVFEAAPGHTETGLAGRPRFGLAPKFGVGLNPEAVATKFVHGILNDQFKMTSDYFAQV